MAFAYVAYEKLKLDVRQAIIDLIHYHHPKCLVDPSRLLEQVKLLAGERRTQAEFLLKVIEVLDEGSESANKIILNAAAYFIMSKIGKSYIWTSPTNSKLYSGLQLALGITLAPSTQPDDDDLIELYGSLEHFLAKNTFNESLPTKGLLADKLRRFSSVYEYKVEEDIIALKEMRVAKEKDRVVAATAVPKIKPHSATSSFFPAVTLSEAAASAGAGVSATKKTT